MDAILGRSMFGEFSMVRIRAESIAASLLFVFLNLTCGCDENARIQSLIDRADILDRKSIEALAHACQSNSDDCMNLIKEELAGCDKPRRLALLAVLMEITPTEQTRFVVDELAESDSGQTECELVFGGRLNRNARDVLKEILVDSTGAKLVVAARALALVCDDSGCMDFATQSLNRNVETELERVALIVLYGSAANYSLCADCVEPLVPFLSHESDGVALIAFSALCEIPGGKADELIKQQIQLERFDLPAETVKRTWDERMNTAKEEVSAPGWRK